MKDEQRIREEIEKTLNSLDGLHRAEPTPFFTTRVLARLENRQNTAGSSFLQFLVRPAFAIASLSIFVALNIGTITIMMQEPKQIANQNELESFAQEYSLGVNTIYQTPTTR